MNRVCNGCTVPVRIKCSVVLFITFLIARMYNKKPMWNGGKDKGEDKRKFAPSNPQWALSVLKVVRSKRIKYLFMFCYELSTLSSTSCPLRGVREKPLETEIGTGTDMVPRRLPLRVKTRVTEIP